MTERASKLTISLDADQLAAARARAEKAGLDSVEAWVKALVEADLRRAELEAQVAEAIDQGDFQRLAAELRDRIRVAPKGPRKPGGGG